jgi:hypothetical protein
MSDPNTNDYVPPPPPTAGTTPVVPEETMSTGQTLTGMFFEPGRVFTALRDRPRFLAAAIVCTIALMAFTVLFFQRVGFERVVTESIDASPRAANMTPEQKEQAIRMQSGPVFFVALIIAAGAGLYLLGSMLMGRTLGYKQALSVWTYSSMPPIVVSMLLNIILLFLKSPDDFDVVRASRRGLVQANLGLLVDMKASPVLGTLLGSFDVFAFYGLFLAALGLRKVGKMSSGSAWGIVLTIWIVGLIVRMSLAGMMGNAM